jgi:hypothetical protein
MDSILTIAASPANNQVSTAAMYMYLSGIFSGTADPYWPHFVLIGGSIVFGAFVGIGVILEAENRRSFATMLVVVGIAFEAICTLLLFRFDETISGAQQSKIATLEQRLLARSLNDAQKSDIAKRLKEFPPQTIQIIPYWQDKESLDIGNAIADAVIKDDWKIHNPELFTSLVGVVAGVYIRVDGHASDVTKAAAKELGAALNDNDVATTEEEGGNGPPNDPLTEQISMQVGIKP